jgi:hypothetical protein
MASFLDFGISSLDINECKDPNRHSCLGITKCVNTLGSYKCEVNKYWIVPIRKFLSTLFFF